MESILRYKDTKTSGSSVRYSSFYSLESGNDNLVPRPSKLLTLLSEGLVCKILYWVGGVKETH